jgi:ABC-type Mn2+/Zn2+ transport system ATPase subunit
MSAATREEVGASLTFRDVVVRYGAHVAVAGVSLEVAAGSVLAVTGSNGSGKSSLIRGALGLAPLTSGSIFVDGAEAVSSRQWRERRRMIAYVPQRPVPGSFPLLVRELLESSGHRDAAASAAEQLGLGSLL